MKGWRSVGASAVLLLSGCTEETATPAEMEVTYGVFIGGPIGSPVAQVTAQLDPGDRVLPNDGDVDIAVNDVDLDATIQVSDDHPGALLHGFVPTVEEPNVYNFRLRLPDQDEIVVSVPPVTPSMITAPLAGTQVPIAGGLTVQWTGDNTKDEATYLACDVLQGYAPTVDTVGEGGPGHTDAVLDAKLLGEWYAAALDTDRLVAKTEHVATRFVDGQPIPMRLVLTRFRIDSVVEATGLRRASASVTAQVATVDVVLVP